MRHLVKKNQLQGKNKEHTKAVLRSLVVELIRAKKIKTTTKKAKLLRSQFDRLVTNAKKESGKAKVYSFFGNNVRASERLFSIVKTDLSDRNSGYTRIVKTLPRKGDGAEQSFVLLTSFKGLESKSKVKKLLEKKKEEEAKKSVGGRLKKVLNKKQ